jgi:spore germination protein YaaH
MTDSKKLFNRFKKNIKWNDDLKLYYLEMPVQKGNVKIWFEDEKSLHHKAELLRKYKLAGAAFWRKGFEPLVFWQNFPD